MISEKRQTVVFISGFLTPTNWMSCPAHLVPPDVNFIPVYPSPTGSLHDRACEVFYELFGGTVDYGSEHSKFHKHEQFGRKFKTGKLSNWDENNPIIVIGHSLGGCTAWVLQNYLAQGMFSGVKTNAEWISAMIFVSAPLNGVLQVHARGMDMCNPPLVRWGSSGCVVGWLAQWSEFFDLDCVKSHMDFQQAHWKISWRDIGVIQKLALSALGFCLHSNTDNVAYDVTIKSQLQWAKVLQTFPASRYVSVVGKLAPVEATRRDHYRLGHWLGVGARLLRGEAAPRICEVDTSAWPATGGDGLLSVHTQEYPRLYENATKHANEIASENYPQHTSRPLPKEHLLSSAPLTLEPGVWHYTHHPMSHLNTALGCGDTWDLLMRTVRHLALQQHEPRTPASIYNTQCHPAPAPPLLHRPDMQPAKFQFPCTETSTGMAYRQRNVYFAAVMVALLRYGSGAWNSNRTFAAMYILLLGVAVVHILKHGANRRYFSNRMHLIGDTAEVVYALYRLVDSLGRAHFVNESTLLCEVLLHTLLPRPLLDLGNQPLGVALAVLIQFVPQIWRAVAQTHIFAVLVMFTALPKLSWLVIYSNQRDQCAHWRVYCRDLFVQCAMMLYLAIWVCFVYHMYTAYNYIPHTESTYTVQLLHPLVFMLLVLFPLNKFQDLSTCLQVVLIEQNSSH